MLNNVGKVKTKKSKNAKPYERPKSILRRVTDSVTGLLPQPSWLANWLQSSPAVDDEDGEDIEEQCNPSTSGASERVDTHPENSAEGSFIFRKPPGAGKEQSNGRAPLHPFTIDVNLEQASITQGPSLREIPTQTNGDDDTHSESTSGCSSLVPHPDHRRDSQDIPMPLSGDPLNIDQSSLSVLGSVLSKSLAADLKSSRGRKTLSLHTFGQNSSLVSPVEDSRLTKDGDGASVSSIFAREEGSSMHQSDNKRGMSQPQSAGYGSKRPRFNITSFGPSAAEARKSLLNDSSIVDSPFYSGRTTYGGASAYRRASLQPSATPFPYVRNRVQARPSSISTASVSNSGSVPASTQNVVLSSSAQRILQALEAMSTPVRDAKKIPTVATSKRSTSFQEEETTFTGFGLSRRRPNLGPPAARLSIGTPALIVPRPQPVTSKAAPSEAPPLVSSTPITSQAGGKMRSRITAPVRESAREAARLREEEEEPILPDLQPVAMPLGLASLPSFSLLPPPPTVSAPSAVALPTTGNKPSLQTSVGLSLNGVSSVSSAKAALPSFTFSAPIITVCPSVSAAPVSSKPPSFNFSSPVLVKPAASVEHEKNPSSTSIPARELESKSAVDGLGGVSNQQTPARPATEKKTTAEAPSDKPLAGFGDKFKVPSGSWVCSVCCISNPKEKSQCAACETPNPNAAPVSTPKPVVESVKPPTTGFGDKFKMSANQWECPVCMLRNSEKDDRCKSCEERRPGAKPPVPASVINFKFGITPGKEPAGVSGISTASTQQEITSVSTEKPASDGAPKFSFGIVSSGQKETETASSGFKFGTTVQPSATKESAPSGFKFGASIEPTQKTTSTTGFTFGVRPQAPKDEQSEGTLDSSKKLEESDGSKVFVDTGDKAVKESLSSEPAPRSEAGGFKFGVALEPTTKAGNVQPAKSSALLSSTLDSTKSSGSSLFFTPAPPASESAATGVATTTTISSKTQPIFSFGGAPTLAKEATTNIDAGTIKAATTMATGSVMDVLGKKSETPSGSGTLPSVSKEVGSTSITSAGPFGALDQNKPTFSFLKPNVPTSTDKPGFSFGSNVSVTPENPAATKSTPLQPSATPSTFSFAAPATSGSSAPLFKPTTTAPSFSFGSTAPSLFGATSAAPTSATAPAAFGVTSTTAPTSTSGTSVPSGGSIFSFGSAPNMPTSTSSSSVAPGSGTFTFGLSSTTSSTAPQAASAAPTFSFGSSAPPPYSFGGASAAPAATQSASAPAPAPVFAFGASTAAPPSTTTTSSEAPKSLFTFGSAPQPAASSTSALTFGSFGTTGAKPSDPFAFGTTAATPSAPASTPAFGDMTSKSSTSTFGVPSATPFGSMPSGGFGAPSLSSSVSPFSFGAQPASGSTQPPSFNAATTPSFSFGSPAPSAAGPTPLQANPSAPVFQFGNAAPAGNQGFGFNANSSFTTPDAPPSGFASNLFGSNPFDITGGSGGAGPNRKIRKAVRRR